MFDARRLLDQVLTSAQSGELGQLAGRFTQPSGTGGTGGASQLVTGALGGGLLGLLVGNKGARKTIGKAGGTALKLGALAAVAALAYTAWQRHKGAGGSAPLQLPPAGSGFAPDEAPAGQDSLARGILAALIQGAKADGHIDAQEQARIFDHVGKLDLDPEAKAFVMDELAAPADMLRRRPDVSAAEARLAADLDRVGVARAQLYPLVRLTGSYHNLLRMWADV